jgi:hypothetical protein
MVWRHSGQHPLLHCVDEEKAWSNKENIRRNTAGKLPRYGTPLQSLYNSGGTREQGLTIRGGHPTIELRYSDSYRSRKNLAEYPTYIGMGLQLLNFNFRMSNIRLLIVQ